LVAGLKVLDLLLDGNGAAVSTSGVTGTTIIHSDVFGEAH
jgi:hypothetical protein